MDHMGNVVNQTVTGSSKFKQNIASTAGDITKIASALSLMYGVRKAFSFAGETVGVAGDYEATEKSFARMLKSPGNAAEMINYLKQQAKDTTASFRDLSEQMRTLLARGFDAAQAQKMLTILQDTTTALNTGKAGADKLTLALSQIMQKKFLTGEELKQLNEQISATRYIAEYLGVDTGTALQMISDKAIDAGTAIKAVLTGMTKDYSGAAKDAVTTINGLFEKMQDVVEQSKAAIGEDLVEMFDMKEGADKLINLLETITDKFIKLPQPVKTMIILFGTLSVTITALTVAISALSVATKSLNINFAGLGKFTGLLALATTLTSFFQQMAENARIAKLEIASISDMNDLMKKQQAIQSEITRLENKRKAAETFDSNGWLASRGFSSGLTDEEVNKLKFYYQELEKINKKKADLLTAPSTTSTNDYIEKMKKELEALFNALSLGDNTDPNNLKDKIRTIFTSLTAETLTSIEQIGRSWQDQINKVLKDDEKLKDDRATYVLKGQDGLLSMSSTINNKMRDDLMKPFEEIDKATKEYNKSLSEIDTQRNKLKSTGEYNPQEEIKLQKDLGKIYDDYQTKLQEQYDVLNKVRSGLKPASDGFKYLTQEMDKLQQTINKTKLDSEQQNKVVKQYNVLMDTVDGLCTVLDKFGDSTEQAVSNFMRALSKMLTIQDGNINFDWENATKQQKGDMLTSGVGLLGKMLGASTEEIDFTTTGVGLGFQLGGPIGALVGGALGLLGGHNAKKARKKMEAAQERASQMIEDYNKSMLDVNYGDTLSELSSLQNRFTNTSSTISYRNWYGKKKHATNPEYTALQEMIQNTQEAIQNMIMDLSKNLRSAVADAFGATNNFLEFSQSLYQSVYGSVKEALLNAFVSSETMKPLFNNLSQMILDATMDGMLTAQEVMNIRNATTDIGSRMQVLYQSLGILDQYLGNLGGSGGSSSGEQNYQAGSVTPIVNNFYTTIEAGLIVADEDTMRDLALTFNEYILSEAQRG